MFSRKNKKAEFKEIELIARFFAEQREEKENPFAIDRVKPFNELKDLQEWCFNDLITEKHLSKIKDIEILKSRLSDFTRSDELITLILSEEFKYSNFIEGIHNDNERLNFAWNLVKDKELSKKEALLSVAEISPDGAKVRKISVCLASNKGVHHTPPSGNRRIHHKLNKLFSFNDDSISSWIYPILFHMQYELIHPLSDGNGRSGRLFLLKHLMDGNKLSFPILISKALYGSKQKYYKELNSPMFFKTWDTSIDYFLDCIDDALIDTLNMIDSTEI
jgi:hypothetical protein